MENSKKEAENKKIRMGTIICLCLGILFIIYGLIVMAVRSGSNFYCMWLIIGAALIANAILIQTGCWQKAPKWLYATVWTIFAIGCAVVVFLTTLILTEYNAKGEKNLDYIIVLGAQVKADGPSVVLKYRLDTALEYLKANPDTVCICTGGQGKNEPFAESIQMKEYLVNAGIDESRIIEENQSKNTAQNLQNCVSMIDFEGKSVGIVTNNFHVFRALKIAKKCGLSASGIAAGSVFLYAPNNIFRENIGILKDIVFGNMVF